jgi:uncharacterized membrane protein
LKYIVAYIAVAVSFLALDAVWLSQMYTRLYQPALGDLVSAKPDLVAAVLFYAIYWFGVVFFCVAPALQRGRLGVAVLNGVLFGLCAYATYDLTNQATLRVWSVRVTVADLAWGMFVTASAAGVSAFVTRRMIGADAPAGDA